MSSIAAPRGRPGTPDEVAVAMAYLAATEAGWTAGQIFQVKRGYVARAWLTAPA